MLESNIRSSLNDVPFWAKNIKKNRMLEIRSSFLFALF
jgi:hypothetical protein